MTRGHERIDKSKPHTMSIKLSEYERTECVKRAKMYNLPLSIYIVKAASGELSKIGDENEA